MQDNNVFPVPPQEKFTRWFMYAGMGAVAVAGTLLVGPFVFGALKTLFDIGMAIAALGALAVGIATAGVIVFKLAPLLKQGLDVLAYNMWEKMIDAYPIVHMRLWLAKVLDGIEESKKAKKELTGIVGENKSQVKVIDDRVKELQVALRDGRTSVDTKETCTTELAAKLELRKPYARVVDSLSPAVAGFDQFINIQERYAQKLENEIDVADANWRADKSIQRGLNVWERVMGRNNQAKINSEAAKKRVEQQLGNSLGKLEDVRKQMSVMVQAAARNDEIAMANARKYAEDQMRAIEVPFVEVKPVQTSQSGSMLNLN